MSLQPFNLRVNSARRLAAIRNGNKMLGEGKQKRFSQALVCYLRKSIRRYDVREMLPRLNLSAYIVQYIRSCYYVKIVFARFLT